MMQSRTPPERALVFSCNGERLIGVLSPGIRARGVVVVVGGPQYRVGSHRQFVQLARALSAHGFPVLRFDYRGLGDSEGSLQGFEFIASDIRAAVDALFEQQAQLCNVVLWGLCDAASASILYAPGDPRVSGVVALNPWVRSAQSEARAWLRHYYLHRMLSREFWTKALRGGLNVSGAVRSVAAQARTVLLPSARRAAEADAASVRADAWSGGPLPTLPGLANRMAGALAAFPGQALIITSGQDMTAAEFRDVTQASKAWRTLLASDRVVMRHLNHANHTFSQQGCKQQVESWTRDWLDAW
jgi:exosortase A-associated hydrolase 1